LAAIFTVPDAERWWWIVGTIVSSGGAPLPEFFSPAQPTCGKVAASPRANRLSDLKPHSGHCSSFRGDTTRGEAQREPERRPGERRRVVRE
jgi:hypothetical protein